MPDSHRILIVDDDVVDRMAVRRALRLSDMSFTVEEADGCAKARQALEQDTYDCIFLDYRLPDGDGLSLVREIRAMGVRTPIIILTAQGDEQVAVELMKAGASDYVPKGQATMDRLLQCLRNALRVYHAEQQAAFAEMERERLFSLEQAARSEAETARKRLEFLAEASTLLAASLEYETTLENIVRLAVPTLGDWCFVDLSEDDGSFHRLAVAHSDPAKADLAARLRRRYAPLDGPKVGVSKVILTGEPEHLPSVTDDLLRSVARDDDHYTALKGLGMRAALCVPLLARGRTLGAISFVSRTSGEFYGPNEVALATELARRAALAVDNARLFQDTKTAEERLRHQLDFTTAITQNLAEGVCALDSAGNFIFVNPAAEAMLGWNAAELTGRNLHDTAHYLGPTGAIVPREVCHLFTAVVSGRTIRNDDDIFVRRNGRPFPVSYAVSPIITDGKPSGAVLAFHDITDRKRAEAELEASRRQVAMSEKLSAIGTLVSGVAHEIRTPLTYITNNLYLIQHRLETTARNNPELQAILREVNQFSRAAMDGVDRVNTLVKDLRRFANPETGKRVQAGLHEVVAVAVELFRATQRGHVIVEENLRPTPPLTLDREQVQRVVLNLLINAAEAMPKGGTVRISTRPVMDGGEIEVEDHGMGIPVDVQARMFDPFFTTKTEGTGLGLSITRRIVESHGGTILFETQVDRGTRFRIFLPTGGLPADGEDGITLVPALGARSIPPPPPLAD